MPAGSGKEVGWGGEIFFLTKSSKFHHGNLYARWAVTVKVRVSFQVPSDGDENIQSVTFTGVPSSSRFPSNRYMTFHELFVRVDFSSLSECITFRGLKDFGCPCANKHRKSREN